MQIPWNLPVKLSIYAKDKYSVVFPVLTKCPCCNSAVKLKRHGFYERNALAGKRCYRISICRYLCPACLKTVSLLPWFLLPYFQHNRNTILKSLRDSLKKTTATLCRQLAAFYHKRFLANIPAIVSALRERHWRERLPADKNKGAIKIVRRLNFTRASETTLAEVNSLSNRVLANFMARSF
ncbi:DUF6431 domain-containing protein [Pelotomaculum terephthalicicum JT]|uniref:DUF6431 domain-containing protein n=1 Tax=Pelotomaculum terephthalicicum TaxID=206393 RepID=UPI001F04576B|nr:DUF6431 domain-containing protein [Pelotomaculum terephthalicicum]MCG9969980.1 DUF6431 domain-containing protein [Pelotomaculum terephthalicicum JT]